MITFTQARQMFPTSKRLAQAYKKVWPLMERGVPEREWLDAFHAESEKIRQYYYLRCKQSRANQPDHFKTLARASYHRHKDRRAADARRLREERKKDPKRLAAHRAWCRNNVKRRKQNDPQFRIRFLMRNRIWMALDRSVGKAGRTVELLGCTIPEFKTHIESLWFPGMSWENYGKHGWHLDHIKPCKSFDLTKPEQQKLCFHYSNVRPLWAKDNLSKGAQFLNSVVIPARKQRQSQQMEFGI